MKMFFDCMHDFGGSRYYSDATDNHVDSDSDSDAADNHVDGDCCRRSSNLPHLVELAAQMFSKHVNVLTYNRPIHLLLCLQIPFHLYSLHFIYAYIHLFIYYQKTVRTI